ncbi:hypothetical protein AGDE_14442 [Angomonas deanei]|nr:hypothetical protein AGDE_14442 [Angomonas deanei]|eukprot:EPY20855.1 hypothetical protein AGDE_14442 [Angomonas deanei]
MTDDGRLRIVGRIKALVKNSLGEYVSLDTLESVYNTHPLVMNNCCCVVVHPYRNYIVLIAVSDPARIVHFAKEANVLDEKEQNLQAEEIAALKKVREAAGKSFADLARKNSRKPFECVRYVALVTDDWTPENGMLTAAMKIKRSFLAKHYETLIEDLFKE